MTKLCCYYGDNICKINFQGTISKLYYGKQVEFVTFYLFFSFVFSVHKIIGTKAKVNTVITLFSLKPLASYYQNPTMYLEITHIWQMWDR